MNTMESYRCAVGKMWVKSFDGDPPDDVGIVRGVHKVVLTDDVKKAYRFEQKASAKSLANKTGGAVVWE